MDQLYNFLENTKWLGIKVLNVEDFLTLLVRYLFNLMVTAIVVIKIYFPVRKDKEYLFTYLVFNTLIFFVCYAMASVKVDLGFAFGLFALFTILRYRTSTLPVKEMTYLFAVVTIAVINSLSSSKFSYGELIFTNLVIISLLYFLEKRWSAKYSSIISINYEKIDNIKPQNRRTLISDLESRLGLSVKDIEFGRVNFLNDTVRLKVFVNPNEHATYNSDNVDGAGES